MLWGRGVGVSGRAREGSCMGREDGGPGEREERKWGGKSGSEVLVWGQRVEWMGRGSFLGKRDGGIPRRAW